jgi:type I restriction enzyme, S subunit
MSYKKVKLSEICTIEKGATGITKAIEGEYPMVTMAEARTSHNEYQFDTKAVLIPLVSSSGHGHASMKRIHYQEGKFAVGSILCALVPKNEDVVNARFLYNYLHFQRESILVPLMRGAANVSLSIKSISSVEINLPPIETQISINKLVDDFKLRQDIFQTELKTQSNLLSKLRQAYLQEAVMGKLTAPSQYNAQTLLKAIKSQKTELIKQGKLRKEKPLAPIKPEEIPFKIPDNWVWSRLGEVCSKIGSGSTPQGSNYASEGFPFFRSQNIYDDELRLDGAFYISAEVHKQMNGTVVLPEDILLNITGGSMGRCALVPNDFLEGNVSQHVCIIRPLAMDNTFFHKLVLSPYFQKLIFSSTTGTGREGLPKYNLERFLVPIPPLSEQKAIVAKVEGLLGNISLLESENKAQQIDVQRLMGAVLQEAFGGR